MNLILTALFAVVDLIGDRIIGAACDIWGDYDGYLGTDDGEQWVA